MMLTAKETAKQVIDRLPEQATWDDILYELYVKQKIEAGLAAAAEGKTVAHEDAKRRLLDG
jgi:predicted transcriptional regulator